MKMVLYIMEDLLLNLTSKQPKTTSLPVEKSVSFLKDINTIQLVKA